MVLAHLDFSQDDMVNFHVITEIPFSFLFLYKLHTGYIIIIKISKEVFRE